MASVASLGVHTPAALAFLVAESILPENPSPDQYTWRIYNDGLDIYGEEEIVTTDQCVVWSQSGVMRRVFRFEAEGQRVGQALLTWFDNDQQNGLGIGTDTIASTSLGAVNTNQASRSGVTSQSPEKRTGVGHGHVTGKVQHQPSRSRALVVILQEQAHIYHLHGSSHIINLPFEVERAFPAPRGLLLQRKLSEAVVMPPTPMPPGAPFNSFIGSQSQFFQSPSLRRAAGRSKVPKNSSVVSTVPLSLADFMLYPGPPTVEAMPRLFTLTDPVSEMGFVVEQTLSPSPPNTSIHHDKQSYTFEAIAQDEEILYISNQDELFPTGAQCNPPLILVLTVSRASMVYSVWHASYTAEYPASAAIRPEGDQGMHSSPRQRASFGPRTSTGLNTPSLRPRRTGRESFGRNFHDQTPLTTSQGRTRSTETTANLTLAPEIDPTASFVADLSLPGKMDMPNRRTSSLLARAELANHDQASFTELARNQPGPAGSFGGFSRRAPSFAGPNDNITTGRELKSTRRSTLADSLRSTEANEIWRRSIGEDATEDMDLTQGSCAAGDVMMLDDPFERFKRELTMTRLFTKPVGDPFASKDVSMLPMPDDVEVFTVPSETLFPSTDERKQLLSMFVMNRTSHILSEFQFKIERIQGNAGAPLVKDQRRESPIGKIVITAGDVKFRAYKNVVDAIKITDAGISRLVRLTHPSVGQGVLSLLAEWREISNEQASHVSTTRLDSYNPVNLTLPKELQVSTSNHFEDGAIPTSPISELSSRTAPPPSRFGNLAHVGILGRFDLVDECGTHHRIGVQLQPRNAYVAKILDVCQVVISESTLGGQGLRTNWWAVCQAHRFNFPDGEWHGLVLTLFCFILSLIGEKRVTPNMEDVQTWPVAISSSASDSTADSALWTNRTKGEQVQRELRDTLVSNPASVWSMEQLEEVPVPGTLSNVPLPASNSTLPHLLNPPFPNNLIAHYARLAKNYLNDDAAPHGLLSQMWLPTPQSREGDQTQSTAERLLVALHLLREEEKLDTMSQELSGLDCNCLGPVLAQIGHWLGWMSWSWTPDSFYHLEDERMEQIVFDDSTYATTSSTMPLHPPSIYEWLEHSIGMGYNNDFPSLSTIHQDMYSLMPKSGGSSLPSQRLENCSMALFPRTRALVAFVKDTSRSHMSAQAPVETLFQQHIGVHMLETLPEAIVASMRSFAAQCQANPPTTWPASMLKLVDREDLGILQEGRSDAVVIEPPSESRCEGFSGNNVRSICSGITRKDSTRADDNSSEAEELSNLIYRTDNRFTEAATLLNARLVALGEFPPRQGMSETQFLDEQKAFALDLYRRTMSIPSGEALLGYCSRQPLPTQKIETPIFNTSCNIQPSNTTVDIDKAPFGEDKAGWAYFHAGAAAGLLTARSASNIETSWLTLNKPAELGVRHAGLLLALGLNGHLKRMAKWLAFKYLTPKHDMTTIGLLLGMSASYFGTMDTLVTRLLSVHVPRLLPPGAAELNLSPLTQTAGIMGIGLLYCNSQHRRMSEVMLSEIGNAEVDDPSGSGIPSAHRDEGYRLAAGFALGMINLGKGKDLRALHDLRVVERLLFVATGPREINVVHILDQATSGAIIAIALTFMKSQDITLARKIDVPSTLRQLEYARPDVLLLRTVAKNIIMWDDIQPTHEWIWKSLPEDLRDENYENLMISKPLGSENLPLYNVLAGLYWSIALKNAGTGSNEARTCLLNIYDKVTGFLSRDSVSYDQKLTRNTLQRFQHLLALAAATVMAGTGDLETFRRLRVLHATVKQDSTFGFHQAAHMAMGALFMGHGRFTFGTSNLAIASLLCAFYPVFPKDAMDNHAHLQAFRHFWTLATEPRCLIARDVETHQTIVTPIRVVLRNGTTLEFTVPHLLPDLDTIAHVTTTSPVYWQVVLDFQHNPDHLATFHKHQTIFLRRKSLLTQYGDPFSVALAIRSESQAPSPRDLDAFNWIFRLPIFEELGIGEGEASGIFPRRRQIKEVRDDLALPEASLGGDADDADDPRPPIGPLLDMRTTGLDDLLVLRASVESGNRDLLVGLRVLFAWAERERAAGRKVGWVSEEGVAALRAAVLARVRREFGGKGVGGDGDGDVAGASTGAGADAGGRGAMAVDE